MSTTQNAIALPWLLGSPSFVSSNSWLTNGWDCFPFTPWISRNLEHCAAMCSTCVFACVWLIAFVMYGFSRFLSPGRLEICSNLHVFMITHLNKLYTVTACSISIIMANNGKHVRFVFLFWPLSIHVCSTWQLFWNLQDSTTQSRWDLKYGPFHFRFILFWCNCTFHVLVSWWADPYEALSGECICSQEASSGEASECKGLSGFDRNLMTSFEALLPFWSVSSFLTLAISIISTVYE